MTGWEKGSEIDPLEYEVKAYLTLGGAVHDAAIAAWSVKGYYDYVRPVSAIRYMAGQGQSSTLHCRAYSPNGIPLYPGFIELMDDTDSLAGPGGREHRENQSVHVAGPGLHRHYEAEKRPGSTCGHLRQHRWSGWILAENWWPYQRPSFVTPPLRDMCPATPLSAVLRQKCSPPLLETRSSQGAWVSLIARKTTFWCLKWAPV